MLRVGVRLHNVLAHTVQPLEAARERGLKHIGDAQSGLWRDGDPPSRPKFRPHFGAIDGLVARQLMGKAAHVATALDVVLSSERVHPHALAAIHATRHREVTNPNHSGGALNMLRDSQAVINR